MSSSSSPTILITGGTGFAGSHLVEALVAAGHSRIHVTHFSERKSLVHQLLPTEQIHSLDLTNQQATQNLMAELQPDHIYHLAAFAAVGDSYDKTKEVIENNLVLQLNLLEAVKQHAPQARLLIVGSAMEYDLLDSNQTVPDRVSESQPLGPVSPYGVSKVLQDLLGYAYGQSYQLDVIRARPFNHIGERQSPAFVVPALAKQIAAIEAGQSAPVLTVGNLSAVRDFTDVKDVVKAYLLLMDQGQSHQVYNIGRGQGKTIDQILQLLLKLSTVEITVEVDQAKLRPADIPRAVADPTKISQLGWRPAIKLEDTLQRVLDYWRSSS